MITKEYLEEELKKLNNDYEVIIQRTRTLMKTLEEYKADAVTIKGAIRQTEKLLALYNNDKNKEESEGDKNDG